MIKILIPENAKNVTNYVAALANTDFIPSVISSLELETNLEQYDGLLLPGGGDIEPSLFQELNHGSRTIDFPMDCFQLTVLDQFVKTKKPVLGICKGAQIINVYFGGTITQDISTNTLHQHHPLYGDMIHDTNAAEDSFLAPLYGTYFITNSSHHQAIHKPGNHLRIIQYSSADHIPEAICHTKLPIYGLQWHPERMCFSHMRSDTVDGSKVFHFFHSLF